MHIPPNQTQMPEVSGMNSAELSGDAGYYSTSPSQLVYPTAPTSLHTTPNTPTSIPDIILTGKRWDESREAVVLTKVGFGRFFCGG